MTNRLKSNGKRLGSNHHSDRQTEQRTSLCLPSLRKFLVRGAQYRQRGKINARMFIALYSRFDRKMLFKPGIISTILRRKADTDEKLTQTNLPHDLHALTIVCLNDKT